MNIKFSIELTEKNIPQLMGLLAKMWDNPNPTEGITIVKQSETTPEKPEVPTMSASVVEPATVPAMVAEPTPEPKPEPAQSASLSAAQLQLAAGKFIDQNPNNLFVLQQLLSEIGATAIPQLTQEQRVLFTQKLRELGGDL